MTSKATSRVKNKDKPPEDRTVGWGKYRLMKMKDVPTEYLQWFVENAYGQMVNRKKWAKEVLELRQHPNLLQKKGQK